MDDYNKKLISEEKYLLIQEYINDVKSQFDISTEDCVKYYNDFQLKMQNDINNKLNVMKAKVKKHHAKLTELLAKEAHYDNLVSEEWIDYHNI